MAESTLVKDIGKYFGKFTFEVIIGGAAAILIANYVIKKYPVI